MSCIQRSVSILELYSFIVKCRHFNYYFIYLNKMLQNYFYLHSKQAFHKNITKICISYN